MRADHFTLRVAGPADSAAVSAVLASAYPALLAADYEPGVLASVLPSMTQANPVLLASGTYYVLEAEGRAVACGGWTHEAPGTAEMVAGVAHIRHFATHVDWIRRGLAARIFRRCRDEAFAAGARRIMCFSSLGAEAFYARLGFRAVARKAIAMRHGVAFPSVIMVWTDTANMAPQ